MYVYRYIYQVISHYQVHFEYLLVLYKHQSYLRHYNVNIYIDKIQCSSNIIFYKYFGN